MMKFILKLFLPCEVMTWIYITGAVLSAGAAISQARATSRIEGLRQQELSTEITQRELDATQQELARQQELRFDNAEALVNAGNIDAFSSPSLLAQRRFRQKEAERDVRNIKTNLLFNRSSTSSAILASKARTRGARNSGILNAGSAFISAGVGIHELGD